VIFDEAEMSKRRHSQEAARRFITMLEIAINPFNDFGLKVLHQDTYIWMTLFRFENSLIDYCASGTTLKQYLLKIMTGWTGSDIEQKFGSLYNLQVVQQW
jgi:hypothetical protein